MGEPIELEFPVRPIRCPKDWTRSNRSSIDRSESASPRRSQLLRMRKSITAMHSSPGWRSRLYDAFRNSLDGNDTADGNHHRRRSTFIPPRLSLLLKHQNANKPIVSRSMDSILSIDEACQTLSPITKDVSTQTEVDLPSDAFQIPKMDYETYVTTIDPIEDACLKELEKKLIRLDSPVRVRLAKSIMLSLSQNRRLSVI